MVKVLDPFFVSRPSAIMERIWQWIVSGSLWRHLAVTLEESLLGLLAGAALGISLGFSFARSPFVAQVFDPYIKMLNAVPRVVLAPLFLLWFGLGIWSKVALAVTLVIFVMFFNTYQRVRAARRSGRSARANRCRRAEPDGVSADDPRAGAGFLQGGRPRRRAAGSRGRVEGAAGARRRQRGRGVGLLRSHDPDGRRGPA